MQEPLCVESGSPGTGGSRRCDDPPVEISEAPRRGQLHVASVIFLLMAVLGLAACGNEEDSTGTAGGNPSKALNPAEALVLAKKSGAARRSIVFTSGPEPTAQIIGRPPPLREREDSYVETATPVGPTIARDPADGFHFELGRFGAADVIPDDISDAAPAPIPFANERALFFANTYPATDTIFTPQPIPGIDTTLQIRGPEAPDQFSWTVAADDPLVLQKGGAAGLLHRERGVYVPLLIEALPFAHDSSGGGRRLPAEVKTELSVDGDRLIASVAHRDRDLVYPVIVQLGWNASIAAPAAPSSGRGNRP